MGHVIEYHKSSDAFLLRKEPDEGWSAKKTRDGRIFIDSLSYVQGTPISPLGLEANFVKMLAELIQAEFPEKEYITTFSTNQPVANIIAYGAKSMIPNVKVISINIEP